MAKLDFPGSPSTNQKYPSPAVAGQPVYTWDGEKWTSIASQYVPGTAPFEPAMAYSGMQINGGFEVSQEKGLVGTIGTGYFCDGWRQAIAGTMSTTATIGASGSTFPGFPFSLGVSTPTAQVSLGAGDYSMVMQPIEGYRIARLAWGTANAQPITIGFWTSHFRAGVYGGSIRNNAGNRSYAFTYTQAASNVAQYNTVTIPGDTTGTWLADNLPGIVVDWCIASGTTFIASSTNTWLAGNYLTGPGQVNGVAATSDVFRITGVTIHPGTQAPTAAQSPNIMRPYDQELVTCQRYFEVCSGVSITGYQVAGSNISIPYCFKVKKRAAPTIPSIGWTAQGNAGTPSAPYITVDGVSIFAAATATGAMYVQNMNFFADARL